MLKSLLLRDAYDILPYMKMQYETYNETHNKIIRILMMRHAISGDLYMQIVIFNKLIIFNKHQEKEEEYYLPDGWWDTKSNSEQFKTEIIGTDKKGSPIFQTSTIFSNITLFNNGIRYYNQNDWKNSLSPEGVTDN